MKVVNYFVLRSIFALVLGLLLVLWPDVAINYLVITVGVLFFVPGLIALINYFVRGNKQESATMFPIAGVGSILFGLWLMIMPSFFVNILMYVLGFILVLGGIQQIASLVSARKWTSVPVAFYLIPVLILITGLIILVNPFSAASAAFIVLGISSIVYAVSELFNGIRFRKRID